MTRLSPGLVPPLSLWSGLLIMEVIMGMVYGEIRFYGLVRVW